MKKKLILLLLSISFVFASCNIITEPNPLIGNYLVRNRVGSDGYIYCFSLKSDGTFVFIQRGGASTSETFIFEGTWNLSLNHFDFYSASGTVTFSPEKPTETSYESLVFTVGEDNEFNFKWVLDQSTVNATLELYAVNDGLSNDIGTAQNISDSEFSEKLQAAEDKVNGSTGDDTTDDDTTGDDTSGDDTTGGDSADDNGTADGDTQIEGGN